MLALALVLRLGDLGPPSLWLDDAWLAVGVRGDTWSERLRVVVSEPGYVLALFAWLRAVGFSDTAAQLPALAAGVGGVWATMGVARRGLSMSRLASLLAGLFVATSPLHLTYSTRVKHYTLDALLTLLVLWAALAVLRRPERPRRAVLLGVTAIAVSAVSGIVAVVAGGALSVVVLAALAENRRVPRQQRRHGQSAAALTAFTGVAALAAWFAFSAYWTSEVLGSTVNDVMRAEHAELFIPVDDVTAASTRLGEGANVLLNRSVAGPWPLAAALGLVGLGAVAVRRDNLDRRGGWRALLLVAPVVGAIGLAAAQSAPWGLGRTELYLVPLIALLAGAAVDVLVPSRPAGGLVLSAGRRAVGIVAASVIVTGAVVDGVGERQSYPVEDVASAVAAWEAARTHGDGLLVYSASRWAFGLYTSGDITLVADRAESRGFHVEVADVDVTLLPPTETAGVQPALNALDGRSRVWFLGSHRHHDWAELTTLIREAGFVRGRAYVANGGQLIEFVRVSDAVTPE